MPGRFGRSLVLLVALALAACSAGGEDGRYQRALMAATREAREHLPFFWEHLSAPGPDEYQFLLKVRLPAPGDGASPEPVWVYDLLKDGETLTGKLASPAPDASLDKDAELTFTADRIVDWAFIQNEKLLGHYTTRVMLPRMPPDQADAMRSMLGENPS